MVKMKYVILGVLLLASSVLLGDVGVVPERSPESTLARNLGIAIAQYVEENGVLPSEWGDLGNYLDIVAVEKIAGSKLESLYILLNPKDIEIGTEGEMVAVSLRPDGQGNYLGVLMNNDNAGRSRAIGLSVEELDKIGVADRINDVSKMQIPESTSQNPAEPLAPMGREKVESEITVLGLESNENAPDEIGVKALPSRSSIWPYVLVAVTLVSIVTLLFRAGRRS